VWRVRERGDAGGGSGDDERWLWWRRRGAGEEVHVATMAVSTSQEEEELTWVISPVGVASWFGSRRREVSTRKGMERKGMERWVGETKVFSGMEDESSPSYLAGYLSLPILGELAYFVMNGS
jgi:hypothetical protein